MRIGQSVEVLEEQLGHLIGHGVGNAGLADQNVGDGRRRHVAGLAFVGAARNGARLIGAAADTAGKDVDRGWIGVSVGTTGQNRGSGEQAKALG